MLHLTLATPLLGRAQSVEPPPGILTPMQTVHLLRERAQYMEALQLCETILKADPADDGAYRMQALSLADLGASERAWELMRDRQDVFPAAERERIEGDRIARRINWGTAYPRQEAQRFDESREALARGRDLQRRSPRTLDWQRTRLRVDELSSLNHLQRHREMLEGAAALRAEGVELPNYILPALADSQMALRQPHAAQLTLQRFLEDEPQDVNARILLAYAWIEQERFDEALPLLETLAREQPAWPRRAGALRGYENWDKYSADMTLATTRGLAHDNVAAERTLRALSDLAPAESGLQAARGAVEFRRLRPTAALERYEMAQTLDPRSRDARLGQFDAQLALDRPDRAATLLADLQRDYPEDPRLVQSQRALDLYRGWQVSLEAGRSRNDVRTGGDSASPLGNHGGRLRFEAQTPLWNDRWRLALLGRDDWADFAGERIRYRGAGVGLRYRYDRLAVSADVLGTVDDYDDGSASLLLGSQWRFSDAWLGTVALAAKDPEASLQARRFGITADSASIGARWTPSETTEVASKLTRYRYEDGNTRDQLGVDASQRLLSRPHLLIDGLASVYTSRGSDDVATQYFNPERDASASLGLRVDHITWRSYEREFRQRLEVTAGPYWQRDYGSNWVPAVSYRHRWQPRDGGALEYGISWSRPVYDGRREKQWALDVSWRWGTAP